MVNDNIANTFRTTLTNAIDNSQVTFEVDDDTDRPSVNFRIRIDNEIMLVTSVDDSGPIVYTVTRNAEPKTGQTPDAHDAGAAVIHVLTTDSLLNLIEWVSSLNPKWPLGSRLRHPDSPSAFDDEFDGSSGVSWTDFGTWSVEDVGSTREDHLYGKASGTGSTLCGLVQAIPGSAPFEIYACVSGSTYRQNFQRGGGIVLFPSGAISGSSAPVYCGMVFNSDFRVSRITYASLSSFGSQTELADQGKHESIFLWVHVIDTTHIDFYWSSDGYAWVPVQLNYNLPFTLAQMGLGSSEEASGGVESFFDFFRVIA